MNKLVSRNPVQRFKEGRKIIKAQYSWGKGFGIENSGKIFGSLNTLGYENPNKNNNFSIGTSARFLGYNPPETQGNMLYNIPSSQEKPKSSTNEVVDKSVSNEEPINNKIEKKGKKIQKKSINPNRFISIYDDKNRTWATHAADNKLTNRNQVKAFQREKLGMKESDIDGIWGKNTEAAYQKYLLDQSNKKVLDSLSSTNFSNPIIENPSNINIQVPKQTYNRTQIREFLRNKGVNPYQFNGAQRKALRMILNGQGTDDDKALVQSMEIFKQGGNMLPSRNIVERFKQRNFRIVDQ